MGGGWGVEEAHLEHGVLARSPPGVQPRGPEDVGDVEGCVVAVVSKVSNGTRGQKGKLLKRWIIL